MIACRVNDTNDTNIQEQLSTKLINNLSRCPDIDIGQFITMYVQAVQNKFFNDSYLIAINLSANTVFKDIPPTYSEWTEQLNEVMTDNSVPFVESFAKAKYYLDKIFLFHTERGILEYIYNKKALITSSQLGGFLKISRATVSRYVDLGMEMVPNIGHRCYPLHNTFYWSSGIWAARIQAMYQSYKLRNRTKEDIINELKNEIKSFQEKYKTETFEEAFGHIKDPYELEEPDDYFNWRDASEDLKNLDE